MRLAFVFPGQGSQSIGMLAELHAAHATVRSAFDQASARLGYDLWKLTQEGPVERLNATECTQPALLTASVAVWRVWQAHGGRPPDIVAGHSLGEFSALVAAGTIDFADAVELVRFRGQVMQEAVPIGAGAMAAILGLDDATVEAVCAEAQAQGGAGQVVEAVNFNSPGQVVIAGSRAAVERASELAKARGAKRAVSLPVSAPFHSSLMCAAAERFRAPVAALRLERPRFSFVSSCDAQRYEDPQAIRELLVRQLASPVRWTTTALELARGDATLFVECGPGKVLSGLTRRAEKRADCSYLCIEDASSLESTLAAVGATGA